MIGSGKSHVRTVVQIAQSQVRDSDNVPEAIRAFASLGSWGSSPQNEERDLHNWLQDLHGIGLQPYMVGMKLQVWVQKFPDLSDVR